MKEVWFWQLIISPHMINLANELAMLGFKVNYVVESEMTKDREQLGWKVNDYPNINIIKDAQNNLSKIKSRIDQDSIHIVQGLRNNGYIKELTDFLSISSIKFWVMLETIDDSGFKGLLRRFLYRKVINDYNNSINGFLTIGYTTQHWFEKVGVSKRKIHPFTYFLEPSVIEVNNAENAFIFIFVGNLIERKRPDLVLQALSKLVLSGNNNFELWIIGGGVLEEKLKELNENLNVPVKWYGYQNIEDVRSYISSADCLLLPSIHDGWGAVASEAIIEGTPVICSDTCGVAGVVEKSKFGSVFEKNNIDEFNSLIETHYKNGKQNQLDRDKLKSWGKCLTAQYGAKYLRDILLEKNQEKDLLPPWDVTNE